MEPLHIDGFRFLIEIGDPSVSEQSSDIRPLVRFNLKTKGQELLCLSRQEAWDLRPLLRLSNVKEGCGWVGIFNPGRIPCSHFYYSAAETPNVRKTTVLAALNYFWSHPIHCSTETLLIVEIRVDFLGVSKIGKFAGPIIIDKDIAPFDIFMYNVINMEVFESLQYL